MFHVPSNVSSYIKCGSQSVCKEEEVEAAAAAGFTAWYSCPVCAYRICSGCASLVFPDLAHTDKFTLESLFVKLFPRFGSSPWQKQQHPNRELIIENNPLKDLEIYTTILRTKKKGGYNGLIH